MVSPSLDFGLVHKLTTICRGTYGPCEDAIQHKFK